MSNRNNSTLAASVAALFLVAACGDHNPTGSDLTANPAAGGANPIVLSARGSGHVELPILGGNPTYTGKRTFSFTAEQRADGSVEGRAQYKQHHDTVDDIMQHGELVCMATLGDGWVGLGFRSTKRIAAVPGFNAFGLPQPTATDAGFILSVKDNGEGVNALEPDYITGAAHTTMFYIGLICSDDNSAYGLPPHLNLQFGVDAFKNAVLGGNVQTSGAG